MKKLRTVLLGIALALSVPLATNASDVLPATGKSANITSIQSQPQGRCCFVWWIGTWLCIPC